ncbi:MAG: hypothetical protein KDM91_20385 [Verrucomicrobiae bacterium]|nr:hypothetical protein [Verrucomicrobiae bacterium]
MDRKRVRDWLLGQQYRDIHPYTDAPPGGWAWTDLPGGVPDADDTPGALLALKLLADGDSEADCRAAAERGIVWLLNLQNRDGGLPTFCRGWGALPFDRSSPDLTAHTLRAWAAWDKEMPAALRWRIDRATRRALTYLWKNQHADGSWTPLWFGNQDLVTETNPTYGTALVLRALRGLEPRLDAAERARAARGESWLLANQNGDGGWGGGGGTRSSLEETALAVAALAEPGRNASEATEAVSRGERWLAAATKNGTEFPAAPIGFYFAKLWYFERLYPMIWATEAWERVAARNEAG